MPETDPYALLEVPHDADPEAIHRAYRRLARLYHPDKVAHLGPEIRALAEKKMQALNAAYDLLGNPEKRRLYDAGRQPPQETPPPRPSAAAVWEAYAAAAQADTPSQKTVRLFAAGGVLLILLTALFWYRTRHHPSSLETSITLTFAREYLANGQPEEALVLLQRLTDADRKNLIAWNLRWQTETHLGLDADAENSLTRAVELDPTDARLRVEYAKVLFRRNKIEQTRAQLAWLAHNGETPAVVALLEAFRRENPQRAQKLTLP